MDRQKAITWIAQEGKSRLHNRRGTGVGYWRNSLGRRRFVAYTQSMPQTNVSKSAAVNILANMAAGNWTGTQSMQSLI